MSMSKVTHRLGTDSQSQAVARTEIAELGLKKTSARRMRLKTDYGTPIAGWEPKGGAHRHSAMIQIQRILCPTALSAESNEALLYGLGLARAYDAKLIVCYCSGKDEVNGIGNLGENPIQRNTQLRELFDRALDRYLPPSSFSKTNWQGVVVESEDVGAAITQTAADYDTQLIVMRSRRRPHRAALLGSSAEVVCRNAPCPVLVTHSDEREWIDETSGQIILKRLLVAYDFSDYAELALKYALSLAQEY